MREDIQKWFYQKFELGHALNTVFLGLIAGGGTSNVEREGTFVHLPYTSVIPTVTHLLGHGWISGGRRKLGAAI